MLCITIRSDWQDDLPQRRVLWGGGGGFTANPRKCLWADAIRWKKPRFWHNVRAAPRPKMFPFGPVINLGGIGARKKRRKQEFEIRGPTGFPMVTYPYGAGMALG